MATRNTGRGRRAPRRTLVSRSDRRDGRGGRSGRAQGVARASGGGTADGPPAQRGTHDAPPTRDPATGREYDACHGWPLDTFEPEDPCRCDPSPPARKRPPRRPPRTPRHDCCEEILRAIRGGRDVEIHKPKVKPRRRLADRCERTTIRDITLPLLMLILRRYKDGVATADPTEQQIRTWLAGAQGPKRNALEGLLKNYQQTEDRVRECVFETRFDQWPDRCALDWDFIGKAFADQAAKSGRQHLFGAHFGMPGRGKARPWERPVIVGYGKEYLSVESKPVTGPWPWICAVATDAEAKTWYRNEQSRTPGKFPPGTVAYEQHEVKMKCKPPSQPGAFTPDCTPLTPADSGGGGGGWGFATCPHGTDHTAKVLGTDTCLDVPKTFPGGPVTLRGLNFLSTKCRIRIRRLTNGTFSNRWGAETYEAELKPATNEDPGVPLPDIPCHEVFGDTMRPDNVATCAVEDLAHFDMPRTFDQGPNKPVIPPGFYEIRLIVPNEENFAFEALVGTEKKSIAPPELYTNPAYVEVMPDPALSYSWAIESAFCHEETSGPGSDEPWVTVMPFLFDKTAPLTFPSPVMAIEAEDIDGGSGIPLKTSPFPLHQGPLATLAPDYVPFIVTCGITGLEVDSEDAAKNQIRTMGAAYVEYLKVVFLAGAGGSSLLEKGFVQLVALVGKTWAIVAAGAAIVIVLGVGLLWAAWAPADPIIADLLMIDPIMAFELTRAGGPSPAIGPYEVDGIKVEVSVQPPVPLSATTRRFRFEHIYRSDDEDSRYGITYRLQRT